MTRFPSLFISHGSPLIAVQDGPAHRFLRRLAARLPRPKAIVVISAHHYTDRPMVTAVAKPETIHDFGGFPQALFDMQYPAPGAPELAQDIVGRLVRAGFDPSPDDIRGIDHGVWIPLKLAWPEADVPVVSMSICMQQSPQWHFQVGRAIAGLAEEGVLIVGSGSFTHNLREIVRDGSVPTDRAPEWVKRFAEWAADKVVAGDWEAVMNYPAHADGLRNHPSPDHILPLFTAMGAGGEGALAVSLHHSYTFQTLAMDAFAFGDEDALAQLRPEDQAA